MVLAMDSPRRRQMLTPERTLLNAITTIVATSPASRVVEGAKERVAEVHLGMI